MNERGESGIRCASALEPFKARANHVSHSTGLWKDHAQEHKLAVLDVRPYGGARIVLYDENGVGTQAHGPDTRSAYREACRQQRLARHTVPALLRERAALQRQVTDLREQYQRLLATSPETLIRSLRDAEDTMSITNWPVQQRTHRRARHAAAIRAHRAALAAQREKYEKSLRACRRTVLNRTKERGDLALGLAAIRQEIATARQANSHVAYLVPDVTDGGLLDAVRVLLKLAAGYAEMHRRATAAEARAEDWKRTVERLEAEQPRDTHDDRLPVGVSSESVAEAIEVRVRRPTLDARPEQPAGDETPTDNARPADAQRPA